MKKKIEKIFKDNNLSYEWEVSVDLPNVVMIYVEWGDWKHDHIYLRNIMQKHGFHLISEEVTEEDGSDAYSATHIYIG